LVGLTGLAITQVRGSEIALFLVLAILVIEWAKTNRRSAYLLISGMMASLLLTSVVVGIIGGGRIWNTFNRNQDTANILTASGRTGVWGSVIEYTVIHPQGMGYIAGIRTFHGGEYASNLSATLTKMGGTDNSYLEVLADAGWLALALYLIMMTKIVFLGWRFVTRYSVGSLAANSLAQHTVRCALLLFMFFLAEGMESSVFETPLSPGFYLQNIVIAIILAASSSLRLVPSKLNSPSDTSRY
jgi:hypothetical protein